MDAWTHAQREDAAVRSHRLWRSSWNLSRFWMVLVVGTRDVQLMTIGGGRSEIHRNMIVEQLLSAG
jgi:alkylation response protein AidB-like acyl-CoA dehydrogenase